MNWTENRMAVSAADLNVAPGKATGGRRPLRRANHSAPSSVANNAGIAVIPAFLTREAKPGELSRAPLVDATSGAFRVFKLGRKEKGNGRR